MRKLLIYIVLIAIMLLLIIQFGPSVLSGGRQSGLNRMIRVVGDCGADCVGDFEEYLRAYGAYVSSKLGWGNAFEVSACVACRNACPAGSGTWKHHREHIASFSHQDRK
jgi:hypothetical protein